MENMVGTPWVHCSVKAGRPPWLAQVIQVAERDDLNSRNIAYVALHMIEKQSALFHHWIERTTANSCPQRVGEPWWPGSQGVLCAMTFRISRTSHAATGTSCPRISVGTKRTGCYPADNLRVTTTRS